MQFLELGSSEDAKINNLFSSVSHNVHVEIFLTFLFSKFLQRFAVLGLWAFRQFDPKMFFSVGIKNCHAIITLL